MIEYYKKNGKEAGVVKLKSLSSHSWIKVVNPTDKDIGFLISQLGLDKSLIMDGLDLYENPRVEEEDGAIYIFLRAPTSTIPHESTSSFLLIVSKNNIITISKGDLEVFDKILASHNFNSSKQSRFVMHALFYVSKYFNFEVRKILKEVKSEKRNLLGLRERDILGLVSQEDTLNDYLSSFAPLIDMHNKILKIKSLRFGEAEKDFIEDLIIDLNQTFNTCKSVLKTISNMREYYSVALSNKINKVITILTIFTVFLTIPTLISGVYGMNISLPFQGNPLTFFFLGGVILLVWAILFLLFRRGKII
ncbi:MAG: magnesium transporter CorA family protein [Nanoarchaeota archaeon]